MYQPITTLSLKAKSVRFGLSLSFIMTTIPLPAMAWQALDSGISNIESLTTDSYDNLYAGGYSVNPENVTANNIAKWDGSTWTTIGNGTDSNIRTLTADGIGNVYAGGYFTTIGSTSAQYIAKWNGSTWSALGTGLDNFVNVLTIGPLNAIYVGGNFTAADGNPAESIAQWKGTNWSALSMTTDNYIYALTTDISGLFYAGGNFTTIGGATVSHVAKWDGANWSALGNEIKGTVDALTADTNNNLYAAGDFNNSDGSTVNYIAQWNGNVWVSLGNNMDNKVSSLIADKNGAIYAGGHFTTTDSPATAHIAKWNGNQWNSVGGGINGLVTSLTKDKSGNIYAGGSFTTAGDITANGLAVYVSQTLVPNQWRMISLPHAPLPNTTLQDITLFGDNLSPATYNTNWVVYERNEATKAYRKLALTDPLVQGKGYWIQSTSEATLDMDGTATPVTNNPNCTSPKGCYEVALTSTVSGETKRNNMIGFPFFRRTSWANVRFEVGTTSYKPHEAEASNIAAKTLWKYNGSTYETYDDVTPGLIGELSKMEGFWVRLLPNSTGKTVKLLLPLS